MFPPPPKKNSSSIIFKCQKPVHVLIWVPNHAVWYWPAKLILLMSQLLHKCTTQEHNQDSLWFLLSLPRAVPREIWLRTWRSNQGCGFRACKIRCWVHDNLTQGHDAVTSSPSQVEIYGDQTVMPYSLSHCSQWQTFGASYSAGQCLVQHCNWIVMIMWCHWASAQALLAVPVAVVARQQGSGQLTPARPFSSS